AGRCVRQLVAGFEWGLALALALGLAGPDAEATLDVIPPHARAAVGVELGGVQQIEIDVDAVLVGPVILDLAAGHVAEVTDAERQAGALAVLARDADERGHDLVARPLAMQRLVAVGLERQVVALGLEHVGQVDPALVADPRLVLATLTRLGDA